VQFEKNSPLRREQSLNREMRLRGKCEFSTLRAMHTYGVRARKDRRSVDLISDALPFGRLWYGEPNAISNAIGYAMHSSRSHHAVIRVYDSAGNGPRRTSRRAISKSGESFHRAGRFVLDNIARLDGRGEP
jgi:hypothetical protein